VENCGQRIWNKVSAFGNTLGTPNFPKKKKKSSPTSLRKEKKTGPLGGGARDLTFVPNMENVSTKMED